MTEPEFGWAATSELQPNPWNPNVMSEEDYAKALTSIERFGFIDPITVRPHPEGPARYQIIDGENRWRAARDKRLKEVPIVVIGATDDEAQELTIILNELRGRPDEARLAGLVADLATRRPMAELEQVLPFRRSQLADMVAARRETIDWDRLRPPPPTPGAKEPKERWVERVFRLPASAAAVVDDAIARAREGGDAQPWQALEALAAEFIATHGLAGDN